MKRKLIIILSILVALAVLFFGYFAVFYHATDDAMSALSGNASVSVVKIDGGYYFDGPGEESSSLWPKYSQEYIIAGGNHAQFGDYGDQKGDGIASITAAEQIDETVRIVNMWWQDGNI